MGRPDEGRSSAFLLVALGIVVAFPYIRRRVRRPSRASRCSSASWCRCLRVRRFPTSSPGSPHLHGRLPHGRPRADQRDHGDSWRVAAGDEDPHHQERRGRHPELDGAGGNTVTNYTPLAEDAGLILHTTVTIGYDAPWRTVHRLLIEAALATPGIAPRPGARSSGRPRSTTSTSPTRSTPTRARRTMASSTRTCTRNPGRVQRGRRRDHVAALRLAARRQHGRHSRAVAAAGLLTAHRGSGSNRLRPPATRPADGAAPGSPRPGPVSQTSGFQGPFVQPDSTALCR